MFQRLKAELIQWIGNLYDHALGIFRRVTGRRGIQSEEGKGSTFFFTLPASAAT